eukprot:2262024-Rhodomonas_salina.3
MEKNARAPRAVVDEVDLAYMLSCAYAVRKNRSALSRADLDRVRLGPAVASCRYAGSCCE